MKGCIFLALSVFVLQASALTQIKSGPGDSGEFAFTVSNAADSAGPLENPHIVYENKPWWFEMGGTLSYPSIQPGENREMVLEYHIADNAPSGAFPLDFKVVFSSANVFPPFWKPAEKVIITIVGGSPPTASPKPQVPAKHTSPGSSLSGGAIGEGWPDINYGNKCHSRLLFPDNAITGAAAFGADGLKIRFKMFANEPVPCAPGAACKVFSCEDFRAISKADIPCAFKDSKAYISPCRFKKPKYSEGLISAFPGISDLNSKVREATVDSADIATLAGRALAYAALEDPSPDVRVMGVLKLDELDGEEAVPALCAASRDMNAGVAYYAVKALGVINSTATLNCLQEAAAGRKDDAGLEASFWLYSHHCVNPGVGRKTDGLPRQACEELRSKSERMALEYSTAFKGPAAGIAHYIAALKSSDVAPKGSQRAYEILQGKYDALQLGAALNVSNDRVSVKTLLAAMGDKDKAVAWGAAMGLTHFDDPRAIPYFVKGLRSADENMRMQCAIGLGVLLRHFKAYEAFQPLLSLAQAPDARVGLYAVNALGIFQAEENAALFADLAMNPAVDSSTKREAVAALSGLKTDKSRELLVAIFENSEDVRCAAAFSLQDDFYQQGLRPETKARLSAAECRYGD